MVPEVSESSAVGRHSVISKIASHDLAEPSALLGDRLVHPPPQLLSDLLQLGPYAVPPGFPLEKELALAGASADVGKA